MRHPIHSLEGGNVANYGWLVAARRWLYGIIATALLTGSAAVCAEEINAQLTLPEQPLAESLQQIAERFDLKIAFYSEFTDGMQAPALIGTFTPSQAFDALLADTSLEYVYVVETTVAVRPRTTNLTERGVTMNKDQTSNVRKPSLLRRVAAIFSGAMIATSGIAASDETSAQKEESEGFIEEIIVTAVKREKNILKVPITMTAFSGRMIEELGITTPDDLAQLTPGLQLGDDNEKTGLGTVIRGIGSQHHGNQHTDLAVAYYVDGVYSMAQFGIAPNLFDVARVEVARGPQGTLHGRNSIAGSISYFSKRPTDVWDADILAEFTDQFTQRYNLAFGGPLLGGLSFRITGGIHTGDGAQENEGHGDDYDAPDEKSIASQLRYKTDWLDINLRYAFTEDTGVPRTQLTLTGRDRESTIWINHDNGNEERNPWYLYSEPIPASAKCPPGEIGPTCDKLENKVRLNRSGYRDSTNESITLTADFDITDGLRLRYTGSTSEIDTLTAFDGDRYNRLGGFEGDPRRSLDADTRLLDWFFRMPYLVDQSSQEIVLISDYDGPLNFILGGFYYEADAFWQLGMDNYANPNRFVDTEASFLNSPRADNYDTCDDWAAGALWFIRFPVVCDKGADHTEFFWVDAKSKTDTKAVFASMDYLINEKWQVSGGLRWTKDQKKKLTSPEDIVLIGMFGGLPTRLQLGSPMPLSDTWDALIWNVSAEYTPGGDTMAYGRISTGYRAGGFNNYVAGIGSERIEKETLVNYEIGFKSLALDQRLQVTAAAFYNTYEGFQIRARQEKDPEFLLPLDNTALKEFTDNVDGTKIWGAEIEVSYLLGERWRISGYYAYLDSKIGKHASLTLGDPNQETEEYWRGYIPESAEDAEGRVDWKDPTQPCVYQNPCRADNPVLVPLVTDKTGNQLPQQPNHKFSLILGYTTPLQIQASDLGTLQFLSVYSYTGERHPDLSNLPDRVMEGFGRLDLRANWTSPSKRWSAGIFVQNVFDEIGMVEYVPVSETAGEVGMATLTEQRRFGLTARWKM